jgi:hypothetical protein
MPLKDTCQDKLLGLVAPTKLGPTRLCWGKFGLVRANLISLKFQEIISFFLSSNF